MAHLPMFRVIGHHLKPLRPSKNRSKRLTKKLNRKFATPMLGPLETMVISDKLHQTIMRLIRK